MKITLRLIETRKPVLWPALRLLLALVGVLPSICLADFAGYVVGVHDGDTVTIIHSSDKDSGTISVKVRLAEIDAPEIGQPFGTVSRKALADMIFHHNVFVAEHGLDRYGRTIGTILLDDVNVNAYMVSIGMAWMYTKYSNNQELRDLENDARLRGIGLWADKYPIAPWDFRKSQ